MLFRILIKILMLTQASLAHGIYFKQSDINLRIPIVSGAPKEHERNRLIKFEIADASSNANYRFSMSEKLEYLHLNEETGELWFRRFKWNVSLTPFTWKTISKEIVVKATSSEDEEEANMKISLHFTPYESLKDFCEHQICFYDGITYNTYEDYGENFKSREIGQITPKFYQRICRDYKLEYQLLNGTEIVSLQNYNKLTTISPLNREKISTISFNIQCHVKSTKSPLSSFFTKVYNVTIMDLNDNTIRVQKNHVFINVTLDSPYFQQYNIIEERIIFLDDDSHDANSELEFLILNDKARILEPICNRHELSRGEGRSPSTAFYCNLQFTKTSHFTSSPYCVVVQAREQLRRKVHVENSTVCIESDVSIISEMLPKPEKRQDNRSSSLQFANLTVKKNNLTKIEYPSNVSLFQNATMLARVAQPFNKLTINNKINFNIIHDPLKAFNVTKTEGIIYIQNATNLADAFVDEPVELVIGVTGGKEITIKIEILSSESNCSDVDSLQELCSRHEFQEDCERTCGIGSKNGRCKWRSKENNIDSISRSTTYDTCVPDLEFCPDGECDALEKFSRILSEETGHPHYICSQDCTREVHGQLSPKNQGIGKVAVGFVCVCDENEVCQCSKAHRTTTTAATTVESLYEVSDKNTSDDSIGTKLFSRHPDCGTVCLIVMIGCPSLLVFMIFFFFTLRRHQVKKMKKRMLLNGSTVSYRESNDTEIININILNEIAKENYLQTYQKFDFDAKWEFDRTKLILDSTLGEGEFGKVMKAYASDLEAPNTVTTVAVKTTKTSHSTVELLSLLSEFQLLQEVSHPNVIKLIGACIRGDQPMIIIEYCCFGSLRSYLRLSRKLEESGDLEIEGVEPVTAKDILSFLWQIAKGMAYLAEIKLVHRDLALRNVLLAEGKVCKISDFGLTRDVYEDDAYLKKSKDRVPVKWMSPESLADHVYTSKTDVWSFGIVGWEILTLGSTPYPGISPQNLYHLLKNGYRMPRPENCSAEIYSLLEACWDENPMMRPSFKVLASQFEKLLGTFAKYLDVDVVDGAISNPSYVSTSTDDNEHPLRDDTKRIDSLWSIPKFKSDISKVDNKKYLLNYDDQLQLLLSRYDKPKSNHETKSTNQKLRYQNDLHTFMKPHRYINLSQPDLLCQDDQEKSLESRYDTPTIKRIKSYIEMRNIARRLSKSSFDDNNNEMPCKRTTMNENLNFNDLDKLLKAEKEITFKFSSLNNLNQQLTKCETKC